MLCLPRWRVFVVAVLFVVIAAAAAAVVLVVDRQTPVHGQLKNGV